MNARIIHYAKISLALVFTLVGILYFFTPTQSFLNSFCPLLLAYALGSIPFGLIFTKIFIGQDIRTIGSGNIGTTNVLRTGKKWVALATLLGDVLKGTVAVLWLQKFPSVFSPEIMPYVLGAAVTIGHIFPVWLNFKGGKGVATILGVLLALSWPTALFAVSVWLLTAIIFRYSSLAALVAVTFTPFFAYFIDGVEMACLSLFLMAIVFMRHIENIKKLLRGEESKIGKSRT
jgi:glycerol-3-phosphate acyltransferase PlsY